MDRGCGPGELPCEQPSAPYGRSTPPQAHSENGTISLPVMRLPEPIPTCLALGLSPTHAGLTRAASRRGRPAASRGRTSGSPAEPCAHGHARLGHDRWRETPAAEVRLGRRLSAGSGGNARRSARQVHPRQGRRRGHPALGRQPCRRRPARHALDPTSEAALPCAACACRSRRSPSRDHSQPVAAGGSSRNGTASAPSSAAATSTASVAAAVG